MKVEEFEFTAFISYRHTVQDKKWAKWLSLKLETYKLPKELVKVGYPNKLGKIYRDEDEFVAAPNLADHIVDALKASEYLIVICSRDTPASKWVNQEITTFRQLGRETNILVLLVDGDPKEALPTSLWLDSKGKKIEPVAADLRPKKDKTSKEIKKQALLRLIACIVGSPFNELERRENRRVLRNRIRITTLITFLLISFLSLFIIQQLRIADQQTTSIKNQMAATEIALIEKGNLLASAAENHEGKGNYNLALALSLEAVNHNPIYSGERKRAAAKVASNLFNTKLVDSKYNPSLKGKIIEISPDNKQLAIQTNIHSLVILNIETAAIEREITLDNGYIKDVVYGDTGWLVLTTDSEGLKFPEVKLLIWDLSQNSTNSLEVDSGHIRSPSFNKDGSLLLFAKEKSAIVWDVKKHIRSTEVLHETQVWDALFFSDGARILTTISSAERYNLHVMNIWNYHTKEKIITSFPFEFTLDISIGDANQKVYLSQFLGKKYEWDIAENKPVPVEVKAKKDRIIRESPMLNIDSLIVTNDEKTVYTISENSTLDTWRVNTLGTTPVFSGPKHKNLMDFKLNKDGHHLSLISQKWDDYSHSGGELEIFDELSSEVISKIATTGVEETSFCSNENLLLLGDRYGKVELWDFTDPIATSLWASRLKADLPSNGEVKGVQFSADCKTAVAYTSRFPGAKSEGLNSYIHIFHINNEGVSNEILTIKHPVRNLAISPDGEILSYVYQNSEYNLVLYEISNENEKNILKTEDFVDQIVFTSDSRLLVTSSEKIRVYNLSSSTLTKEFSFQSYFDEFSIQETRLASDSTGLLLITSHFGEDLSGDEKSVVSIWDSRTYEKLFTLNNNLDQPLVGIVGGEIITYAGSSESGENLNINIWSLPYFFRSYLDMHTQKEYRDAELSIRETYLFSVGARLLPNCLTPMQRQFYYLSPDPPCWCQEKKYPPLVVWEEDYVKRHPELHMGVKGESWTPNTTSPNPFTHKRDDGWTCPVKNLGYSAPWNNFPELNSLSPLDILEVPRPQEKKVLESPP